MSDISVWSQRKSANTYRLREFSRSRIACRYCGKECGGAGLTKHERACQGVATPPVAMDRCACGQLKPRPYRTCWRCASRSPELRALDARLAAEHAIRDEWRGEVEG